VDLLKRAGQLKPVLVRFAMSPRFEGELTAEIAQNFPGGIVTDEEMFSLVLDHFALQHRLGSGTTVVEEFVAAHPELTGAEREMLLGWQDVVEGMFEVRAKDQDGVVLFNYLDELTYRARSNLGRGAFRQLGKGMIVIGRLVPIAEVWMVSGNLAVFPASARGEMLAIAARQAMSHPEAVFRNPAKLAEARSLLAEQRTAFVDLFGADRTEVPGKIGEFHRHWARQVRPGAEPADLPPPDLPDEILDADGVAIHFVADEGLSCYPGYDLLEELFSNPALLSRRRYRETLSGFLRDPDTSPEPLRRLAARDPAKASALFARLLRRKQGFSWEADGEQLLRENKPGYFDGTVLPRTVVLSDPLSEALQHARP